VSYQNIDVILIKDGHNRRLDELVLDILEPRYEFLGLEDAMSSSYADVVSACVIPGWGIVVDVGCRLRASPSYWPEVSAKTSVLLVHVGKDPMIRRYANGQLLVDATGVQACRALLSTTPSARFTELDDGEILAHALIEQELGADLFDATSYVGFTVFGLDGEPAKR
jgi:hypothetical protein